MTDINDPSIPPELRMPVQEVVIGPAWQVLNIQVNGQQCCVVRFVHPKLGAIAFLLNDGDAAHLGSVLTNSVNLRSQGAEAGQQLMN